MTRSTIEASTAESQQKDTPTSGSLTPEPACPRAYPGNRGGVSEKQPGLLCWSR